MWSKEPSFTGLVAGLVITALIVIAFVATVIAHH